MTSLTPTLKLIFLRLGLVQYLDQVRMLYYRWKNKSKNNSFKRNHPHFVLPDDAILYETFRLDYAKYFVSGQETAQWIISLFQKHSNKELKSVLDWGCGPARVVRHMPSLLPEESRIYGSDFNDQTIDWCRKNITSIHFVKNQLDPPIDLSDNYFQLIYAISVFTHLSVPRHTLWLKEMHRILVPSGLFMFTSQGNAFKHILTNRELQKFERGQIITRGPEEGRRTFSTFHPPTYIRSLLEEFQILEHVEGRTRQGLPQQDLWIAQRNNH